MNINEYIYLFFQKDEEAIQLLIDYFRPMLGAICTAKGIRDNTNIVSRADIFSEADALLIKCLYQYRPDMAMGFNTYYRHSVSNLITDLFRYWSRHAIDYMNDTISLDSRISEAHDHYLGDFTEVLDYDVHHEVMIKLEWERCLSKASTLLSPIERTILDKKIAGWSSAEIAESYGVTMKKVQYTMRKVKKFHLID